jgi:Protein of unknown function (DUF2442)
MSVLVNDSDPRAVNVEITTDELQVELADGRRIITPLAWFPLLLHATSDQLQEWELLGDGEIIHWPQIDEDLSVTGLLRGTPVQVPAKIGA